MSIQRTIRNILIAFFRLSGIAFLYRTWAKKRGPLVRIVVFHDVTDESWFDAVITTLCHVYHVLTPEDFKEKRFMDDRINVLVTFDDGYASWEYHVVPILEKHGVKALFFINSGLLDVGDDREASEKFMRDQLLISPRSALTWGGAKLLAREGHTIGSHAEHHVNLAELKREDVKR
jgi:peptidoglycan/xylan/chitin deacetylase (PgdA/CDA1 family)